MDLKALTNYNGIISSTMKEMEEVYYSDFVNSLTKIMVSPNLYGSSTVKLALQPKMKHLLHLWMSSVFQTGILLIRFNQPN